MNLRNQANGQPCTLELPGCDGGGETTVLAHVSFKDGGAFYRKNGIVTGHKAPDTQACWACYSCHDILDRRAKLPSGELISDDDYYYYGGRGIARTATLRSMLEL